MRGVSHSDSLFSGSVVCNSGLNVHSQLQYTSYIAEVSCELQNNPSLNIYFVNMWERSKNAIISKYILNFDLCLNCANRPENVIDKKCPFSGRQ